MSKNRLSYKSGFAVVYCTQSCATLQLCLYRNTGAPITAVRCMRQGNLCVYLWFKVNHVIQSDCQHRDCQTFLCLCKHLLVWSLGNSTNECYAMLNEVCSCSMLHLSWREIDCWNSPVKSNGVQEAFKPLPVCWLVYRKSRGCCIVQSMAFSSDWAA